MSKSLMTNVFCGIVLVVTVYGNAQAEEMTPALRKDVYNKIIQDCNIKQKGAAENKDIPVAKIDEYCKCGASSISKKVVASDIRYAQTNGAWPDSFNSMMIAESQKCYNKVMSKVKRQ